MNRLAFSIGIVLALLQQAQAQLITYKAPEGAPMNSDFTVKVRQPGKQWQTIPGYLALVDNVETTQHKSEKTSFAYFDFAGLVEVSVTSNKGVINEARIRPLSAGIKPKIAGNTLTFSLSSPRNLSIEVNGDIFHNLHLFANALENYKPSATDPNVLYYGPGIHRVGTVTVPSNKTVYVAGDAIVVGDFWLNKVENVRILGHGIITQLPIPLTPNEKPAPEQPRIRRTRTDILVVEFSKNIEISGPIVMPHKYSITMGQVSNVKVSDFKSLSSEGNADGIDIFSSSDVVLDNIFMRNSDDCIAIYGHRWEYYGDVKNITVKNSVLWADVAHPINIGTHGNSPATPETIGNITFENIDILDQKENQLDYQGCISLNAGDSNFIRDIRFDNIRIEDIRKGQLVNLRVMYNSKYNTSAGRGIENIYFKNISYNGKNANVSMITGYDETRGIKNITFENLKINGTVISDDMPGKPAWYKTGDMANFFIGQHVDGVRFIKSVN